MNSTRFSPAGVAFRSMVGGILLALIAASATGCGQRGPLYLPEAEAAANGPAAAGDAEPGPDSPAERGPDQTTDSEDTE